MRIYAIAHTESSYWLLLRRLDVLRADVFSIVRYELQESNGLELVVASKENEFMSSLLYRKSEKLEIWVFCGLDNTN